jgi:hypothetical protein
MSTVQSRSCFQHPSNLDQRVEPIDLPRSSLMKKLLTSIFVALATVAALSMSTGARADGFGELRAQLSAARESLITLLVNKDKRGADQQKIVKDTADAVSAHLARLKAPPGKEAQFKELVDNWNAFKKTREVDLVPAILAGKDEEARKIAGGIQKERITRCQEMVSALGG